MLKSLEIKKMFKDNLKFCWLILTIDFMQMIKTIKNQRFYWDIDGEVVDVRRLPSASEILKRRRSLK